MEEELFIKSFSFVLIHYIVDRLCLYTVIICVLFQIKYV